MSYWCSLVTSLSKAPSTETIWTVLAILASALIAVVAAYVSARLTMKNALKLQDRDRGRDEKSVAALLSADLHRKLLTLVLFLSGLDRHKPRIGMTPSDVETLEDIGTSTRVLEAALPKLGGLGHLGVANLLSTFDGIGLLVRDARVLISDVGLPPSPEFEQFAPRVRYVALHIGRVVNVLCVQYELDRPDTFEKSKIDLEALDLKELKDLGF